MKARSLVVGGLGGLLAGVMLVATSVGASANLAWCMADPPLPLVTPGGNHVTVNNYVYLPPSAADLFDGVTEQATAQPDGRGGTLITDRVYVPVGAHVVASVHRYGVSASGDGAGVITIYLDIPTT